MPIRNVLGLLICIKVVRENRGCLEPLYELSSDVWFSLINTHDRNVRVLPFTIRDATKEVDYYYWYDMYLRSYK